MQTLLPEYMISITISIMYKTLLVIMINRTFG